jgi:hypothetical protein
MEGGDGDHGWRRKRIVVFPAEKCCSATAKYIYAPMRRSLPSLVVVVGICTEAYYNVARIFIGGEGRRGADTGVE